MPSVVPPARATSTEDRLASLLAMARQRLAAQEEGIGEAARALFVIDQKGVIRWSMLSPDGVNPGADGILSALEKLK